MQQRIAIIFAVAIVVVLACSIASPAATGDVWLGSHLLLRIRTAAGGYSIEQRVDAIQLRANNLLQEDKVVSAVTVQKSGYDANIYTDGELFMTVTAADARANGTTVEALANQWAQRIKRILPQVSQVKPGVGPPLR